MMRILSVLLATAALPAAAQETTYLYGGLALEYSFEPNGAGSDDIADVELYLEVERAGFYAGFWAQKSSDELTDEIDLYLGYRRTLDSGLSYDVGYTRYAYPNDGGDCCGEVTFTLGVPAGDMAAFSVDLAYDPEAAIGNAYLGGELYPIDRLTLSANAGIYQVEDADDESEWDIGATWNFTEEISLDARYYEGSEYEGYVALFLALDTTILGD